MAFLKPTSKGKRDVLSNSRENGRIVNPPRMAELGGLSSVRKGGAMKRNDLTIRKPGGTT